MVFVGLQAAYNSVLAFTSALNKFLEEMYDFANPHKNPHRNRSGKPTWLTVQELASKDDRKSAEDLQKLVEDAERRSIKLPVVRVALQAKDYGDNMSVEKGQTIILDIFKANDAVYKAAEEANVTPKESDFIAHESTAADHSSKYKPKHIADVGVTAMIRIFAQMRDARRGHDAQGRVKKVRLDASAEGYTNYMAPMRIQRISEEVKKLNEPNIAKQIYTSKVLRPETDTYLTAEWDEMVPFPNSKPKHFSSPKSCTQFLLPTMITDTYAALKIRFDGFGRSTYASEVNGEYRELGKLREPKLYDGAPPYYQPRGASYTGGTFADVACTYSRAAVIEKPEGKDGFASLETKTPAGREPTISNGCGIGK
ncbi:hypothetical protein N0V83_000002 [Neocucurbitaria cava]|uniref:Uncharacterized protein n=1 Tax=Neocucurbitaria cava TaxID=798079 RepID=A0A9W8YGE4_9PLEO|nr:hypothetical protein N0V83_000002 [Neocucurbitaria cava]